MPKKIMSQLNEMSLKKALEKRGLTMKEASEGIGHSINYLGGVVRKGVIPNSAILSLKAIYNIQPEEYIIEDADTDGRVNEDELKFSLYALRMLLQRTKEDELKEIMKQAGREVLAE